MNKKIYIRLADKISFKRIGKYLVDDQVLPTFIIECDDRYYDFYTGEEYKLVEYGKQNGYNVIMNDVLENTFYVRNVKSYEGVDEESINQALEIIKYTEYIDELKKQKNL